MNRLASSSSQRSNFADSPRSGKAARALQSGSANNIPSPPSPAGISLCRTVPSVVTSADSAGSIPSVVTNPGGIPSVVTSADSAGGIPRAADTPDTSHTPRTTHATHATHTTHTTHPPSQPRRSRFALSPNRIKLCAGCGATLNPDKSPVVSENGFIYRVRLCPACGRLTHTKQGPEEICPVAGEE